jgi:hypothetical protein
MHAAESRAKRVWTTGIGIVGSGAIAAAIAVALPTLMQTATALAPLAA